MGVLAVLIIGAVVGIAWAGVFGFELLVKLPVWVVVWYSFAAWFVGFVWFLLVCGLFDCVCCLEAAFISVCSHLRLLGFVVVVYSGCGFRGGFNVALGYELLVVILDILFVVADFGCAGVRLFGLLLSACVWFVCGGNCMLFNCCGYVFVVVFIDCWCLFGDLLVFVFDCLWF